MADGAHRGDSGKPSGTPGGDGPDAGPAGAGDEEHTTAGAAGEEGGAPGDTGNAEGDAERTPTGDAPPIDDAPTRDAPPTGDHGHAVGADRGDVPHTGPSLSGGEVPDAARAEDSASPNRESSNKADRSDTPDRVSDTGESDASPGSRRYPVVTRTTSRPQGGSRVAAGSSPAPFRQWPLLAVLGGTLLGLLLLPLSFRAGLLVVGGALLGGAVLRVTLPAVGMLAVRSRFTDVVTYGLLGTLTVLLTVMAQPRPWLEVPFLNDLLRFSAGG